MNNTIQEIKNDKELAEAEIADILSKFLANNPVDIRCISPYIKQLRNANGDVVRTSISVEINIQL